jgi:hypothetical protein
MGAHGSPFAPVSMGMICFAIHHLSFMAPRGLVSVTAATYPGSHLGVQGQTEYQATLTPHLM